MNKGASAPGFTLLEMLAATGMVAVLVGSLYASLHIAFKARDSALRSVQPMRRCNAAFSLLKEDLQSAAGPNGILAGPFVGRKEAEAFGGRGDSLSFYAAANDVEAESGICDIKKVEFVREPTSDGKDWLITRRLTTNLLSPTEAEPRQETVCRGVRAFALRYFDGSSWQDTWDSTTQANVLPTAVEVTIELDDPAAASSGGTGYRMTRVLLIPCGQPAAGAAATGTSSSGSP